MFVTTVIPVYNGERYLAATLESVGKQTRAPDLLIVQDNCSTDSTPDIVAAFKKRYPAVHCEFRRNETNIGGLGNFNRALTFSDKTDVLHILSADDLIKPAFFERLLPLLEGVRGRALVHCELDFIDENGRPLPSAGNNGAAHATRLTQLQFLKRQAELRHVYCQSVLLGTARLPPACTFRTDLLQASDVIFFSEWAAVSDSICVWSEPLCEYRVHAQSTTGGNLNNLNAWVLEEWRAMEHIAQLMKLNAPAAWLHRQKRKCIFAARSKVKMQMVHKKDPAYASAIADATRSAVGAFPWILGNAAVLVRDTLRGKLNPENK